MGHPGTPGRMDADGAIAWADLQAVGIDLDMGPFTQRWTVFIRGGVRFPE